MSQPTPSGPDSERPQIATSKPLSDPVALLAQLVERPSIAGQSNRELIAFVSGQLAAHGIDATIIPATHRADALNLHAVIGPSDRPGLMLAAHTDVVPVAGQPWTTDPFALTRRDQDRLYGRGTTDMKGFIAALLAVLGAATAQPLERPLHIALSCDEEIGCRGVGPLLAHLAQRYPAPELVVVGEPTGLRIADRHKGKCAFRVTVHGHARHSSQAPLAVNAVSYAAALIAAIDANAVALAAATRDPAFEVPQATLSVGPIAGGVALNIVPDRCTFEFELRYLPGQDPEPTIAKIHAAAAGLERLMAQIDPQAKIEFESLSAYPPLSPSIKAAIDKWSPLADREQIAVDFGTEAGLYADQLKCPVIVCGPGEMARAHRADEFLRVGELDDVVDLLRALVLALRA